MFNFFKPKSRFTKPYKIVLGVIGALIIIRAFLPAIIRYSLNDYLKDHVEGYTGHIGDFDLSLWRGAYQIQDFTFKKVIKGEEPRPFIDIKELDLSLSWGALFRGFILLELKVTEPKIIFSDSKDKSKQTLATDTKKEDWQDVYRKLVPFNLEELRIEMGEIKFANSESPLPVDVHLTKIDLIVHNIHNSTKEKKTLFSDYSLIATMQDHAPLKSKGSFDIINEPFSFDVDASLEKFELTKINNFFKSYGPLDITKGTLDLYIELASTKNKVTGYIKPMLNKVDVLDGREELKTLSEYGFEFGGALINLLFRNGKTLSVATKIPVEGDLKAPNTDIFYAFVTALDHAWGKPAVKPKIDNEIDLQDARRLKK